MAPADIHVEVALGLAAREVRLVRLSLPAGSTVRDALRASGLFDQVAGFNEDALAAGQTPKAGTQEPGRHTVEPLGGPTTLKEMVKANHDYRKDW